MYCCYYTKGVLEKQEKKGGFVVQKLEYTVLPEEDGVTVKTLLQNRGISTGMIRRLKQAEGILLGNNKVTVTAVAHAGQTLVLQLPQIPSEYVKPIPMDLSVVYEDQWVLVVNKPSGVPIHPSAGHHNDSLAGGVAYYLQQESFVFHPITRLDRYTSGLVLIAKNSVAAAFLCERVKNGEIQKTYYAVTEGIPHPAQGEITAPILRQEGSVIKRTTGEGGKPSCTQYEVLETKGNLALVKALPITGRTHQIRVHLAYLGTPLLYDFLYGNEVENKNFLLQCVGLTFPHPCHPKDVSLEIPCTIW